MKVLVLGGTGAMGVPLVRVLSERGDEVFVTSRKVRSSDCDNVHYLVGDAHDEVFVKSILTQSFDAVVDFMIYSTSQFNKVVNLFLENTGHYFFLSSSRVYADAGDELIREDSPRLLDSCHDEEYLKTDEYALRKAREEDILRTSGYSNWTIIRPYITFNDNRLQLGVLEKENWLQRALSGKAIVFSEDIASKLTTLTYGEDVSKRIATLIGKEEAKGQAFHITTNETIRWSDVLSAYLDAFERVAGWRPRVHMVARFEDMAVSGKATYQVKYDRLYNRRFDNTKIVSLTEQNGAFGSVFDSLEHCLENFLKSHQEFNGCSWGQEGFLDRLTHEHFSISSIPEWKGRIKYILGRYLPRPLLRILASKI